MTEKPETISESLKQMDVSTIRRIILEAEAYLAEMTYTSILSVLRVGIGLGLDCSVMPPNNPPELRLLVSTVTGHPAGWKSLGKLITTTGTLMSKAGVRTHANLENTPSFDGGTCAITIQTFPPSLSFLKDSEDNVSAQDVLAYLNPPDDN